MEEKEVNLGINNYDLNKELVKQACKPISKFVLTMSLEKNLLTFPGISVTNDNLFPYDSSYFMLLNRETADYTLFKVCKSLTTAERKASVGKELTEILLERGEVLSADVTETKDALEIWLKDDLSNEVLCYYFFAYDTALVEVK